MLHQPNLFSQPENWEIRNYSTKDGLSSNTVNCILKDSQGFKWFGTNNGLNRFDGYTFIKPRSAEGKTDPLFNSRILSLEEDSDGVIWIGTENGLYKYNPAKPTSHIKHFLYFKQNLNDPGQPHQPVNSITEDKNGLLWMTCMDANDWLFYWVRTFIRALKNSPM